jgi:hypothetical protein
MAVVGLGNPSRDGAANPRTSIPGTKAMVPGRSIPVTRSSAPATRNMGRQRVRVVRASRLMPMTEITMPVWSHHRIRLRRVMRVKLSARYRSADLADDLQTAGLRRCERIRLAAS